MMASGKLAKRLERSRKLREELRRGAARIRSSLDRLRQGEDSPGREDEEFHPLHAVYIDIQNATSIFAEQVSRFAELDAYARIVGHAQDEYIPGGPPISPLTVSYFTFWAFYDVRFGPDKETMGTCMIDLAAPLGLGAEEVEAIRLMSDTRMGIYQHVGVEGGRVRLRELVTGDEFDCLRTTGYVGAPGELWYVRLCPPIAPVARHVIMTTPYILTGFGEADWTAYLSKSLIGLTAPERRRRLHEFLKYGRGPNFWSEYILRAYHRHIPSAIYLAGIPDVPGSLPHA